MLLHIYTIHIYYTIYYGLTCHVSALLVLVTVTWVQTSPVSVCTSWVGSLSPSTCTTGDSASDWALSRLYTIG